jgi:coenzyme F420-reducing hydrogenase beta subunit
MHTIKDKEYIVMKNISNIKDCYGCGVCAAACGKNAISIHLNKYGFYQPIVDENSCVNCGICVDICAFSKTEPALNARPIKCWAAWSNDEMVRRKCSSGGIGFEIGKQLIEKGYKTIGCRYDIKEQRAEHFIATTVEELIQSIGSKYIQSYTEVAFKQINRKGDKYLIIGTPCQIDSFRRMIQKFRCEENFILMDFFCHSVPSMWAWKAYINMIEPKIGKVTYASWRNKFEYGWHDNWLMGIDGEKTSKPVDWHESYNLLIKGRKSFIQSRWSQGDMFYKLFLGDMCSGPQCERDCKYKCEKSSADIRIGDLWGKAYEENQDGVSALISFTNKGSEVIRSLDNVTLIEHPFELVSEGQMKGNAKPAFVKPVIMYMLTNGVKMDSIAFRVVYNIQRGINVVKRQLKKRI